MRDDFQPLFLGACSRSGTTLLGAMLGAGRRSVTTPESQFLPECHGALGRGEIVSSEQEVYRWIRHRRRFRIWGIDPDPADLSRDEDPQALVKVVRWLVACWAEKAGKPASDRWIDHTPTHLRHGETLRRLFPGARFVHLVRDGRGVAASVMRLPWGPCDPASAARW